MSERRQTIIRLLETRDEHLPELSPRQAASAGFIHDTYAPTVCPTCEGVDSTNCTGCGGRGSVERHRTRDPYATNDVAPYGLDGERHRAAYERDRQIDALERQLRPARKEAELMAEANESPYPWERARDRMHRQFDHRLLDRVLDELRAHDDVAYRALHAVYVYKWLTEISGAAEQACDRGFAFLSPRLAAVELARGKKLRAPGIEPEPVKNLAARGRGADRRALDQRDEVIRREIAQPNASTRAIALKYGLSVSQVNRIVSKAA